MHPRALVPLVLCLCSLQIPASAVAQEGPPRAADGDEADARSSVLYGEVVLPASGEPVEGAEVFLLVQDRWAVTDEDGRFRIEGLVPGPEVLQVRLFGHLTPPDTIVVPEGVRLQARLAAPPSRLVTLEELVVSVRREQAVWERQFQRFDTDARSLGHRYLDAERLRELDLPRLSWAFPYLSLRADPFDGGLALPVRGMPRTIFGQTTGPRCAPAIFVNDVRWGAADLYAVDVIDADDVVGIAVYRSPFVPPRYRTFGSGCGVVAVWTDWGDRMGATDGPS